MNIFSNFILIFSFLNLTVTAQPLANPLNDLVNSLIEKLKPEFRRHRARFRPYRQQFGSPMIMARDTEKFNANLELCSAECIYTIDSLFCSGIDDQEEQVFVECESILKLNGTSFSLDNAFWISTMKLGYLNDQINLKFNLHAQIENKHKLKSNIQFIDNNHFEIFSLHLSDRSDENGIAVKEPKCFSKITKFFSILKRNDLSEKHRQRKSVRTLAKIVIL
ncbi:hypothetical protein BpHYR1_024906 [Brachionus plicatilis]|uniref:Uncharacterized protein n=1 Tax=Brachionus plicatilis TaxID=10195 RepID=A0A3M7QKD5_BRAPC|nr:hypothetical protein BpHYR1_024906 [Brachionus plicatilis]